MLYFHSPSPRPLLQPAILISLCVFRQGAVTAQRPLLLAAAAAAGFYLLDNNSLSFFRHFFSPHIIGELAEVQLIILTKQLPFQISKLAGERAESYCVQTKADVIFLQLYFTTARADFIFLLNTNKVDSPLLYGLCTFPLLHPLLETKNLQLSYFF